MRSCAIHSLRTTVATGAVMLLLLTNGSVRAEDEMEELLRESQVMEVQPEQIIAEKNLFSADRKRWDMPEKQKPQAVVKPAERQDINRITLYGTIIVGERRQAILRAQAVRRRGARMAAAAIQDNRPYMVGDYIEGYQLTEIHPRKVVLHDESTGEDFDIFVSEEKTDRVAVKTEIREDPRVAAAAASARAGAAAAATGQDTRRAVPAPRRAETSTMLRQRAQRSLNVLKTRDSDLVRRQAQRDIARLEQLLPHMSPEEQQEFAKMKVELDAMMKK
jgi:ribonucleotide monophosphatase NagD (HAD superfamily)